MNVEISIPEQWSVDSQSLYLLSLPRVNRSCTCERNIHVKGRLLVNGSGTYEQDLQLTSATPRVNGTNAHDNALKHIILCLSTYHDYLARPYHIPCDVRQAIPYTMWCPPGHSIYHAMAARPYHTPFLARQAIIYTMPCPPSHTIYYAKPHALPARQ